MKYESPSRTKVSFTCPFCSVLAQQETYASGLNYGHWFTSNDIHSPLAISKCHSCNQHTIWLKDKMIYPLTGSVKPPNKDLPDDVREDYLEAASILTLSPKGAAALFID